MTSVRQVGREPIAIVGIGCRYPNVSGADELWELLLQERDVISEAPKERYEIDQVYDPRAGTPGKVSQRGGGFLQGVLDFDPDYFHISAREAAVLDPQQRLLLEVTAEALDDAWLGRQELSRHTTGVYVGCWTSDWEAHEYRDPGASDIYSMNGSIRCMLSGRISYAFDLRGPSMTVDAGCSASLLGVHLACQSLWLGECTLAVASGVNLVLDAKYGITFSQGGMLAADSRCKSFDASGDGFVRSDGCATVVLMPWSAAAARGARVYGLIRGTGASNDGFSNGLLATPSELGQQLAIRAAYRCAQLSPREVQYVEAHGTGTRAGDPVELRALSAVMSEAERTDKCWVGSVKSNLGHTEAAAGITGLIKTVMALQHRTIPRSLNAQTPTSAFAWESSALRVALERQPWPDVPVARAGVSSFGLSGTDVHVLVEEVPQAAATVPVAPCGDQLLLLSAASESALRALARRYGAQLDGAPELYALCRSAALGRHHHEQRLCVLGSDAAALRDALAAYEAQEPHPGLAAVGCTRGDPRPVFVFSGQGSQCDAMARELLDREPVFRAALEACDVALSRHASWSLMETLRAPDTRWAEQPIDVIQPTIFAFQVALTRLLAHYGVQPAMIVGHSMGEVAAAHIAGAISLDDAALIITTRSQNLQAIAGRGAMLSVELSFREAEAAIADYRERVGVAASNSAQATVLSGDPDALTQIASMLRARGVFCREVAVDAAAHSPQLDPLLPEFARKLRGVRASAGTGTPLFSTVTAGMLPADGFDAAYWVRNQREPVRFHETIVALLRSGQRVFVEIAPHPIVLGPIQQTLSAERTQGETIGLQRRAEPQRRELLRGLGRLHALGQTLELSHLFPEAAPFVALPRYPFQRERLGVWPRDTPGASAQRSSAVVRSALHPRTRIWEIELGAARWSYLSDHMLGGEVVSPGALYVDLALVALGRCWPEAGWRLSDLQFIKTLAIAADASTRVQITLEEQASDRILVSFFTALPGSGEFVLHARAFGRRALASEPARAVQWEASEVVSARGVPLSPGEHVRRCAARGIGYGPAFQAMRALWLGDHEALAEIELPGGVPLESSEHAVHPVLLDAAMQAGLAWALEHRAPGAAYVPVAIEQLTCHRAPSTKLRAHARVRSASDGQQVVCDVVLADPDGQVAVEVTGLRLQRWEHAGDHVEDALYGLSWVRAAEPTSARQEAPGTWLLLADRSQGVAKRVARALAERSARCVLLYADQVDAGSGMLAQLREAASDPRHPLRGVVSFWPIDCEAPEAQGEAAFANMLRYGPMALTDLTKLVLDTEALASTALWVVTAGAQRIVDGDDAAVAQAPVWALARSVRSEFPRLSVHTAELSARVQDAELAGLVDELTCARPAEQLALRGAQKHMLQLVRAVPPLRTQQPAALCRPDATYLVTGGLGALGMLVAEHLASQGARQLVLMGRSQPKPEIAARLAALRERGVTVRLAHCDVSDGAAVRELVDSLSPALGGLVHAAGVLDDGVCLQLTAERFERVMAPKVRGAWHLHRHTRALPLDFFVMFSSAASVLGNPGQGNYASANEFMDALAQHRRVAGLPALSINWGPWQEAGLAATPDRAARLASRGLGGLTDAAGIATLDRLMRSDTTQAVVLPNADFTTWKDWYPGTAEMLQTLLAEGRSLTQQASTVRALSDVLEHERVGYTERYLSTAARRVLRMPTNKALAMDQSLNRLGLDSLMAVELKNRIDADLGVTLPVSKILLCDGLSQLACEIVSQVALLTAPDVPSTYDEADELLDELAL